MISMRSLVLVLAVAVPLGAQPPRTLTLRGESLERARQRVRSGDPTMKPAYEALIREAREALRAGPFSVTDKQRVPPSGDKHDYMSLATDWWPDSTRPDGLPYVRRDGQRNPDSDVDSDRARLDGMTDAVWTLALAFHFTRDERYAHHAIRLLDSWFITPPTRMNPNLRFAQGVPGVADGRAAGIVETREMGRVVDAVAILRRSRHWQANEQAAMIDWCRAYLGWLRGSAPGAEARAATDDHGSWYDAQVVALALFVGDTLFARSVLTESVPGRVAAQIADDGAQPAALARARSLSQSVFNLEALTRLAELGRGVGVDLWRASTPAGARLRRAIAYVAPYADSARAWPGPQVTPPDPAELLAVLRRAMQATGDTTFAAAIHKVSPRLAAADRSRLLYPDTP